MPVIFKDFVGKNMRFFVSFFRKLFVKMKFRLQIVMLLAPLDSVISPMALKFC